MNNKNKFNLKPLFISDDDPAMIKDNERVRKMTLAFVNKWKNRSDYLIDKMVLLEALNDYETWKRECGTGGNVDYYFWLRNKQDTNNPNLKAKLNNINDFSNKMANDILFFELMLAKIDQKKQIEFLAAPELIDYHSFLESLFKCSKHLLSENEEKIILLKKKVSYTNWVDMLNSFLVKSEREVIVSDGTLKKMSFSEIVELTKDSNKKIRNSAVKAYNEIITTNLDVAEEEMNSILSDKKIDDELRGYSRPEESRLLNDNIEIEIIDALISAVSNRFELAHRFYALKTKLLGFEKLTYNERNLKYGEIDKIYSWEKGTEIVSNVMTNIDSEFSNIFSNFLNNGAFDVFPNIGKTSGAFCVYFLKSQPVYILLNYNNTLQDVITLAHEVGHGINDELMRQQNALNFKTSIATAEVASTFMEDFVLEDILANADDNLRLSIMMMKLNSLVNSIFRQVALFKFEQEIHSIFRVKGYLSKEELGEIFYKNMTAYLGDSVSFSNHDKNNWVAWPHIRLYFYVYSYASGLLISKYLQKEFKKDHSFIIKIKDFLAAGSSVSPKELFNNLNIDISNIDFWQTGLDEIEILLNETEVLAKKLKKI